MSVVKSLVKLAVPASMAAGLSALVKQRSSLALQHNTITRLDENIYLMDYREEYDIEGVLRDGASNIVDLMKYAVKHNPVAEKAVSVGTDEGGGCTTFEAYTPEGDHTLGRNFDFREAPCFVVWTHPQNRYASLSVVDNNFLAYGNKRRQYDPKNAMQAMLAPFCCVDGINEKGLAIAVLQIRAAATKQTDPAKKDITTTAMIRAVLDTCATVDEAVELFGKYNMHDSLFTAYHYQIIDKTGRSVVIEYIGEKMYVYERGSEKYPVAGSVFENDGLKFQYVCNFTITKEIGDFKVEQHGEDRIDAVKEVLIAKDDVMTEMESMDLLSHVRLDYDHPRYPWRVVALWSAVYNADKQTVKLVANRNYKKVYTFAVNKPCEVLDTECIETSAYTDKEWQYL